MDRFEILHPCTMRSLLARSVLVGLLATALRMLTNAHPPDHDHVQHEKVPTGLEHGSLAETGAKLSNPVSIYGKGEDRWQVVIRPAVPVQLAAPRPDPVNNTNYDAGLADILFPVLVTPPQDITGSNLIFGVGPTLALPTSTKVQLGRRQWQMGPAAVVGWKTEEYVVGVFPQYSRALVGAAIRAAISRTRAT